MARPTLSPESAPSHYEPAWLSKEAFAELEAEFRRVVRLECRAALAPVRQANIQSTATRLYGIAASELAKESDPVVVALLKTVQDASVALAQYGATLHREVV